MRLSPLYAGLCLSLVSTAAAAQDWTQVTGDGAFGHWVLDGAGLPAYDYTCDQATDPRAEYQTFLSSGSSRDHWFQLGNDRLVALAHVDGTLEIFDLDDVALVRNHRDDASRAYAGGFGYLVDEQTQVYSTHHDDLPAGAVLSRRYGVGYAERILQLDGLILRELSFAPAGNVPGVVQTITVTNPGTSPRAIRYFPYWDVNLFERYPGLQEAGGLSLGRVWPLATAYESGLQAVVAAPTLASADNAGHVGVYPSAAPVVFLAQLDGVAAAFDSDERTFFGRGDRSLPEALMDGEADGSRVETPPATAAQPACLVLQTGLTLAPGASSQISYFLGFTDDPAQVGSLVASLRAQVSGVSPAGLLLAEHTSRSWQARLPHFSLPGYPALARELTWDAYMLSSAALWSRYADTRLVTQGGAYAYDYGLNTAPRDPLQHTLALVHTDPTLAADTLRYWLTQQRANGHLPYCLFGSTFQSDLLWKPSDFSLWLLLAAVEYLEVTGDTAILDEELSYYPARLGRSDTVLGHLRAAWDYQVQEVGLGEHGLIRLGMFDWNDALLPPSASKAELLETRRTGESTLNTALAVALYPRLAALLADRGEVLWAQQVEVEAERLETALREQWRDAFFNRGYVADGVELGADILYLEPQPWALLAEGLLSSEEAGALLGAIAARAQAGSPLGARVLEVAHADSEAPGELTNGGIWASVNGWLSWGAARWDGAFAMDELLRNTLAWHATAFPNLWFGIWGGPDSYNSDLSDRPGETWALDSLSMQAFPIQNLHPHAWPIFATLRGLGIEPGSGRLTISPRWPLSSFSLELAWLSLEVTPARVRLSLLQGAGRLVRVEAPAGWDSEARRRFQAGQLALSCDGKPLAPRMHAGGLEVWLPEGGSLEVQLVATSPRRVVGR